MLTGMITMAVADMDRSPTVPNYRVIRDSAKEFLLSREAERIAVFVGVSADAYQKRIYRWKLSGRPKCRA